MALNVLIVDDSAVMRSIIKKTLIICGLSMGEIHEAGNGKEGLEILDKLWIDLALVDINMPVMNGEEMIEQIRNNPELQDLPVIVVSTESSETRVELLQNMGATFVHKPFTPEILRERIINVLGGKINGEESGDGTFQSGGSDF